jgi:hypothetical protein
MIYCSNTDANSQPPTTSKAMQPNVMQTARPTAKEMNAYKMQMQQHNCNLNSLSIVPTAPIQPCILNPLHTLHTIHPHLGYRMSFQPHLNPPLHIQINQPRLVSIYIYVVHPYIINRALYVRPCLSVCVNVKKISQPFTPFARLIGDFKGVELFHAFESY